MVQCIPESKHSRYTKSMLLPKLEPDEGMFTIHLLHMDYYLLVRVIDADSNLKRSVQQGYTDTAFNVCTGC
jgi:hypothetical protein